MTRSRSPVKRSFIPIHSGLRASEADLILITHDHHDHCSPEDVKKIQGPNTIIVAPAECAKKLAGKIVFVKPGDKITVAGIEIKAVTAYNTNKQFHNVGG
jgi:L-ascorbate metabolism protein UlaG (beta-lactamase superfamily)